LHAKKTPMKITIECLLCKKQFPVRPDENGQQAAERLGLAELTVKTGNQEHTYYICADCAYKILNDQILTKEVKKQGNSGVIYIPRRHIGEKATVIL